MASLEGFSADDVARLFNVPVVIVSGYPHYEDCLVARYTVDDVNDPFPWCTCNRLAFRRLDAWKSAFPRPASLT